MYKMQKSMSFTSIKLSHFIDKDKIMAKLKPEKTNCGGPRAPTAAGRVRDDWSCLDTKHDRD